MFFLGQHGSFDDFLFKHVDTDALDTKIVPRGASALLCCFPFFLLCFSFSLGKVVTSDYVDKR